MRSCISEHVEYSIDEVVQSFPDVVNEATLFILNPIRYKVKDVDQQLYM